MCLRTSVSGVDRHEKLCNVCRSLQIASSYRRRLLRTSLLTQGFPNIFLGLQKPLKASKIPFVLAKTPTIGGINGGFHNPFQEEARAKGFWTGLRGTSSWALTIYLTVLYYNTVWNKDYKYDSHDIDM